MPFAAGETVGPYQIIEQLGQGGMATVYKAYHPALDRYVAIKGMHTAFTQDTTFLARFRREAQVVAKLEHPNIVPVYDYSEHEGQPYLVMKFIEGRTLKARLSEGKQPNEEILRVVEAVGAALSYAHQQGILHRDIKPSNVMMGDDGRIYLTDFGLARIAQAGESTMSVDVMLGTPQYISPEQALGKRELDEGTDIYSFGVMLYEMIVGQVPYSADTPYSIVHDHIYTPLPLPHVRNEEVPEPIERVLLKALAKQREARYENVDQLVRAFKDAFPGTAPDAGAALDQPVGPHPAAPAPAGSGSAPRPAAAAPTEVSAKPRRRWRWWMAIPLGIVICLCGLIGLSAISDNNRAGVVDTPAGQVDVPPDATQAPPPPGDSPPGATDIDRAMQNAEENPEDPFVQLDLARAFWDAGRFDEAGGAFEHALELGGENLDFMIAAGDFLFERELWLEAAEVYFTVGEMNNNQLPPRLIPNLERAAFNAAADPRINESEVLNRDVRPRGISPLFIQVVRARRILHFGDPEEARPLLEEVLQQEPGYPPGRLLEAEFHALTGDVELARALLEELVAEGPPIGWVHNQARALLFEINQ